MASSHDGTCPRALLQGLVAGTSPLVFVDLYGQSNLKNVDFLFQGGISFVAVKGVVRIYYKQQQYVRQAQRIVKNYGEEWTRWLACVCQFIT